MISKIYKYTLFAITLSFFAGTAINLYGHGITAKVIKGGVGVQVQYADNNPVGDSDVTVYKPGDEKNPFCSGTTDINGRFAFIPDRAGKWRIKVDDGMGHGTDSTITVDRAVQVTEISAGGISMVQKIIMAICVLWGAVGTALFFKRKREA